jgi:hypothetical protein
MSRGALALEEGVLFVARYTGAGEVLVFDLDGRQLEAGFCLGGEGRPVAPLGNADETEDLNGPQASQPILAAGLAVDGDRRLWLADAGTGQVRCATLFGKQEASFTPSPGKSEGTLRQAPGPVDVALADSSKWSGVFVASPGKRVGAVGLYLPNGHRILALRSEGSPQAPFDRISRIFAAGDLLWVVEAGARRVQVFREGDFHYSFSAGRLGISSQAPGGIPVALAPVGDGRLVIAAERAAASEGANNDHAGLFLVSGHGTPIRRIAAEGAEEGQVTHPVDVVVETIQAWPYETEAEADRRRRVVVLDRDGDRIQVFNLFGRCYGAFPGFGYDEGETDLRT